MKDLTSMKLYLITYSLKGVKVFNIMMKEICEKLKNLDTQIL